MLRYIFKPSFKDARSTATSKLLCIKSTFSNRRPGKPDEKGERIKFRLKMQAEKIRPALKSQLHHTVAV